MKKVLFLMFLLLLCLETANVKAQVRIGGNAAPNASAVLDLNAGDATTGNQGLVLPRVALTSNTMLLPGVTQNVTGMMVYNTITTGGIGVGTIGIYVWTGSTWNKANLPSATAADSAKILMWNGTNWVANGLLKVNILTEGSIPYMAPVTVTWLKVADADVIMPANSGNGSAFSFPTLSAGDFCHVYNGWPYLAFNSGGAVVIYDFAGPRPGAMTVHVSCYRPSA